MEYALISLLFPYVQNIYILHIVASSQGLFLEIEHKLNGDIWYGQFGADQIEEMTLKAKNPKKFHIFIKMLMTSLLGQTESVLVEVLTYSELEKKMNLSTKDSRRNVAATNNKKYLIMTYISEFDKAHFPLKLDFIENPSTERLKMTIKRLSQELTLNGEERLLMSSNSGSSICDYTNASHHKELSMLKYENQSLKARIKNFEKLSHNRDSSENILDRSNVMKGQSESEKSPLSTQQSVEQLNSTISALQTQIQKLKEQNTELASEKNRMENLIIDLKQELSDAKEEKTERRQNQQTIALLEERFDDMNRETRELVEKLAQSREQNRKDERKIEELQRELQEMIGMQQSKRQKKVTGSGAANLLASSRQSGDDGKSVKSYRSNQSQGSRKSMNGSSTNKKNGFAAYLSKPKGQGQMQNKKTLNNTLNRSKRSSVYDSDTESSKQRRLNNARASPYRQSQHNLSTSSKKSSRKVLTSTHPDALQKNKNRLQENIFKNRGSRLRNNSPSPSSHKPVRSRSRSAAKQENSPPAATVDFPTDNFSSSEDDKNITEAMSKLKERKNRRKVIAEESDKRSGKKKNSITNPLEKKISNIAQMIRKAKSRDKQL